MAYNPFNIFRRNQRALFAVLTVFIMIMFTISFGAGDVFDRFGRSLGGRSGPAVCAIDGDAIKEGDVGRVRRNRVLANTFMSLAAVQTASTVKEYANQQQSRLSEDGKQMAQAASQADFYLSNPQLLNNPMFGRTARGAVQQAEQQIAITLESPNAKSEDKDTARAFQALLVLRQHLLASGGEHFFLNAPNRTSRDVIEFMLWERKADRLGIHFTREDVKVLLAREFYNFFRSDVEVRKQMTGREGFNLDAVLDALATEFKVRAAQAAALGPAGKVAGSAPTFGTPFEMFEYYREQCSPAAYEVIAVPALAFTDKVTAEPSERELKELYDKYANDEPNPAKETFGFKEPRKLSISWLALTGEEPYYQKLAAEQVKVGEVMAKVSGLTAVPVPGVGGGWGMAAAAPLALKEPAVDAAYQTAANMFRLQLDNEYRNNTASVRDLLPSSVVRPATPVALLGGMVGQSAPFGGPAAAVSLAVGVPIGYEVRDRVKTGLPLLLGAGPNPAFLQTAIGGAVAYELAKPKPLPIEAMRADLLKTAAAERAKALAFGARPNRFDPAAAGEKGDVARFTEEVEKLSEKGKAKDKAAVEKYITEFKAARGLTKAGEQFGATTAPRDEWNLEEDPGLAPLVRAQRDALALARGAHGRTTYIPFGRGFFRMQQPDMSGGFAMRSVPTSGTYAPKPFPAEDRASAFDEGRAKYVYWVTEDIQPKKVYATAARDEVRAAWKRMKARELAQAKANSVADAVRNDPKNDALLLSQVLTEQAFKLQGDISPNNDKGLRRARKFTLDQVCPLVPADMSSADPFNPMGMQPGRLQPFALSESENIPYPTLDMVNALLDNREKPAKTVLVLADGPKDTFYVATLVRPSTDPLMQKSPDEFKRNVYAPNGPAREFIAAMYQGDTARKARQSVIDLLKKEFKYAETDEQKKKLDDNAKSGGRD